MTRNVLVRNLVVGTLALAFALLAVPASAQLTSVIRGKVTDEAGKPVEGAVVKGVYQGDISREFDNVKTNAKGEFLRAGLAPGNWRVSASKDGLVGTELVVLTLDQAIVTIKIGTPKNAAPAGMTAKQIEENNKKQAQMEADFNAAKAAFDSGDYDTAVMNLQKIIVTLPTCAACYLSMGDAYNKKGDLENAEKAYLKSIDLDATKPAPYAALATIYNGMKKFDEAGKMSAKANELSEASGTGGDASTVFNQGVILWNQSKAVEAEAQFLKASKLDPKMADAFYWLGMCRINQGKLPDAKAPFLEYMKLAPTGQYADQVKAMLDVIK
ncbi:MAG: tetratricopeptide repeat protein [Acidobacteria bacterium]|nr:MAG: tetratricopeptide repeat protein [Acidobacteriota bacterium]